MKTCNVCLTHWQRQWKKLNWEKTEMGRAYFITGTDTAVGKTRVATALLRLAQDQNLRTLGLKPVSAGCEPMDGIWMNDDARDLMLSSNIEPDYATVNPVALREPMAPHIAAEREGRVIEMEPLAEHCRAKIETADFTVIEGAGGWQVPINEYETMADLAVAIACPVVLVVGMRLGCINHALLTVAAIENSGLQLAGWVANHIDADMPVADENVAALTGRITAPLLGRIPWLDDPALNHVYLELPD
jgi:dethiobiotin synthetase